ncbi:MAG: LacI family DNA-binding transcriptional regulator [Rikenellaceae bacterium]
MKRVTIKDIAKHLTISVSTVSRALSGDKNIRRETREMVEQAAKELGYTPNPVAMNLKFGRSNTVGVVVPEMVTPYASQVIAGVQELLYNKGIKVIITESHESWEQERDNLSTMERFMVDGILVSLCDYVKNRESYEALLAKGMPIVFFDRIPHGIEASQVVVDDYIKSFFLTEHLIRSGRKRIVHLRGSDGVYNSVERYRGYAGALKKFDIESPEELVVKTGMSFEDGAAAAQRLLDDGTEFDAIFAFTDTLAIGAMNRLREAGKRIPEDVAIVSFSGTTLSEIVYPQLTSVESPLTEMGRCAAELLLEKIADPAAAPRTVTLESQIRLRASSEVEG